MKILFTFNLFLLSLALINTAGCSTSNWYAGMQASHESACLKLPIAEYQDCMQRSKKSYNTYDKERQQLKNSPLSEADQPIGVVKNSLVRPDNSD